MEKSNFNSEIRPVSDDVMKMMSEDRFSCIVENRDVVLCHKERGVKPVADFWSSEDLKDAVVADRVIGKASALFAIGGGAAYVYGSVMSQLAADILEKNGVPYSYGKLVPAIKDRSGEGMCPMESTVTETDSVDEGIEKLLEKMSEMNIG